ncbi:MAG: DPP IV N-terminal domain-containing protein, partial [Lysobacterales bacterium]
MPNAMHKLLTQIALALLALVLTCPAFAERETVLKQIRLPHNYYFREMYLPQLTSGPSSLTWSPDGANLAFSMQGSLWVQSLGSTTARQLTDGPGYDYQPDWSPDGRYILFARYLDDAVEIYRLELESGSSEQLTSGGDVNLEPRWSPDGKRIAWVSTH